MKVSEIFKSNAILNAFLEESDGEITPEIEDLMKEFSGKIEETASFLLPEVFQLRGEADAKKEYANSLLAKSKSLNNKADNRVKLIDNLMRIADIDSLSVPQGSISFRKSSTVEIDDENLIPEQYFKIKPAVKSLDKMMVKADLKNSIIDGVHIEEHKKIQIGG